MGRYAELLQDGIQTQNWQEALAQGSLASYLLNNGISPAIKAVYGEPVGTAKAVGSGIMEQIRPEHMQSVVNSAQGIGTMDGERDMRPAVMDAVMASPLSPLRGITAQATQRVAPFADGQVRGGKDLPDFWRKHVSGGATGDPIPNVDFSFGPLSPQAYERIIQEGPHPDMPNSLTAAPGVWAHMDEARRAAIDPHISSLADILKNPNAVGPNKGSWEEAMMMSDKGERFKSVGVISPDGVRLKTIATPVRESVYQKFLEKWGIK